MAEKKSKQKTEDARVLTCYLSYKGPGEARILGVGEFTDKTEPVRVNVSIANQFDTEDMKARGWIVTRK